MDVLQFSSTEPCPSASSKNHQPIQATAEELNLLTQTFKKIHVNKNNRLEKDH